ncbi:ribonuclease 3-like [Aristolochia californica]|uniref:ribonuclease 3-like n=1 Tax=Aristolochia californica TaxID=171875 RepID=UPI0035D8339A
MAPQLQPILTDLQEYWPSISCPSNSGESDWESTWNDNGICTGFTQVQYFTKALALRSSADLLNLLADKGIAPSSSRSYNRTDVVNAINDGLGGTQTAVLHCGSNSSSIIRNVRLCTDSTASTFISCSDPTPSTCAEMVTLLPLASTTVEDVSLEDASEFINPIKMVVS